MARIAFIDDDRALCALWQEIFLQHGHETRCFHRGVHAVRSLSLTPSDLAIVDLVMPGMNGLECIERLRLNQSATHFLLISGYLTAEVSEQARRLGIHYALSKPFSLADLIAVIESLLGTRANAHGRDGALPCNPPTSPQYPYTLTCRECEVWRLLQQKLPDKEIAKILAISPRTVHCHVHSVFRKLQIRTRQEAVAKRVDSDSAAGHNLPLGQNCHGDDNIHLGNNSCCQITPRD